MPNTQQRIRFVEEQLKPILNALFKAKFWLVGRKVEDDWIVSEFASSDCEMEIRVKEKECER